MTVDFGRLLAEQRRRRREPDLVATFRVERGSFAVPGSLVEAEDDYALRVHVAKALPEKGPRDVVTTTWERQRGGDYVVRWRRVTVLIAPA